METTACKSEQPFPRADMGKGCAEDKIIGSSQGHLTPLLGELGTASFPALLTSLCCPCHIKGTTPSLCPSHWGPNGSEKKFYATMRQCCPGRGNSLWEHHVRWVGACVTDLGGILQKQCVYRDSTKSPALPQHLLLTRRATFKSTQK
jgi:hypothetical protein